MPEPFRPELLSDKLRENYNRDIERSREMAQAKFEGMSLEERKDITLADLQSRTKTAVETRYMYKLQAENLRQELLTGAFPEPFEGWGEEKVEALETRNRYAQKIADLEWKLFEVEEQAETSTGLSATFASRLFIRIKDLPTPEELREQRNTIIDEMDAASTQLARADVYYTLYNSVPFMVARGTVESVDELLDFRAKPELKTLREGGFTASDPVISELFNKVVKAMNPIGVEELVYEDMDYDEIATAITKPVKVVPKPVHRITIDEIINALQAGQRMTAADLPGSPTAEEALDSFKRAGLEEEEVAELEDIEYYITAAAEHYSEIMKQQELVKLGLAEAKMPELGFWDELKLALIQPGLIAMQLAGKVYSEWAAPWAGTLYRIGGSTISDILPFTTSRDDTGFDWRYEEARKTDNWWTAAGKAWEDAGMGWANRLIFEVAADPLTWFGTTVPTKLAKPIPFVGKAVGVAEQGWIKAWDRLVFDQIKRAGRRIPKSPTQYARDSGGMDLFNVADYLVSATGGVQYRRIPVETAQELLLKARMYSLRHPDDWATKMGKAGQAMLRRPHMSHDEIKDLLTAFGSTRPVTRELGIELQSVLGDLSGFGKGRLFNIKAAPPMLLRTLGLAESAENLAMARAFLKTMYRGAMKKSDNILLKAKNTPDILSSVFKNTMEADYATRTGFAIHNWEMAGAVQAQFSKIGWKTMNFWRNTIDRWIVTPFARTYLVHAAYGPFNVLEGYFKPLHAGIRPASGWSNNPIEQVRKIWSGIHKPLEIETGTAGQELYREVPQIADVVGMSSTLRTWRYVTSGGPLSKLFIDLPAKIGARQRAGYWNTMAMRMLGEEARPVMQELTRRIDDMVRGFSKDMLQDMNMTADGLRMELLERAIAGPTAVRNMIDDMVSDRINKTGAPLREAFSDNVAQTRVQQTIANYVNIPAQIQDNLVTRAGDGRLWKDFGQAINETVSDMKVLMLDQAVHKPEFFAERMKTLADEILESPARNVQDYQEILNSLRHMQRVFTEGYEDANRAIAEIERVMRDKLDVHQWMNWRWTYRDEATLAQINFADSAGNDFNRVLEAVRTSLDDMDLTLAQKDSVRFFLDAQEREMKYITREIIELNEARRTMMARKPASRAPAFEKEKFWEDYFDMVKKTWDKIHVGVIPFRTQTEVSAIAASEAMGMAGPPRPVIDASMRQLTKLDLAGLFHSNPAQASLAALRLDTMALRPKGEFIHDVKVAAEHMAGQAGRTADDMGWTDDAIGAVYDNIVREMRMSPEAASVIEPQLMELESLRNELWSIYNTKALPEGLAEDVQNRIMMMVDDLETIPGYAQAGQLTPEFATAKQTAADRASKEYYKDFADYTNENITSSWMKAFFPFWTYELHRPFWLTRTAIRQPGVFKAWGTYMDMTEDGYVHIPGTDLSFNPLRGTIWMGGMIRMIRADYPEYYDRYSGLAESLDYLSRMGFYPAAYLNFLKAIGGTSADGRPQFGELIPAWVKTPLDAYVAAFPESEPAKLLKDVVLPDPYRDYMTMLLANKICDQEKLGFNGRDIWDKIKEDMELTEEEKRVWSKAGADLAFWDVVMQQAGIFKIETEEKIKAWEQSGKLIEEMTGYTPEQQLWIRRVGQRVGDFTQLNPLQQDMLQEIDSLKYHYGATLALQPSSWQEEDRVRSEFFREVESLSEELRSETRMDIRGNIVYGQAGLDRLARSGAINMKTWDSAGGDLRQQFANSFEALASSERYKNVPITLDDIVDENGNVIREGLATRMKNRGQIPPVEHPGEEILHFYHALRVEQKFDEETGNLVWDWDGYFLKVDAIIQTLSEVGRQDLVDYITKEYTDLEKLRWQVAREWFIPYNRKRNVVIAQFSEADQRVIREYLGASTAQRKALREVESEEGGKLISKYESMNRNAGLNLRSISPELDAWLLFFGRVDSPQTDEAWDMYLRFKKEWGLPQ